MGDVGVLLFVDDIVVLVESAKGYRVMYRE